jgi:hypothetical protein
MRSGKAVLVFWATYGVDDLTLHDHFEYVSAVDESTYLQLVVEAPEGIIAAASITKSKTLFESSKGRGEEVGRQAHGRCEVRGRQRVAEALWQRPAAWGSELVAPRGQD